MGAAARARSGDDDEYDYDAESAEIHPVIVRQGTQAPRPEPDRALRRARLAAGQLPEEAGEPVEKCAEAFDRQPVVPAGSFVDGALLRPTAPEEQVGPAPVEEHHGALLVALFDLDPDGVSLPKFGPHRLEREGPAVGLLSPGDLADFQPRRSPDGNAPNDLFGRCTEINPPLHTTSVAGRSGEPQTAPSLRSGERSE